MHCFGMNMERHLKLDMLILQTGKKSLNSLDSILLQTKTRKNSHHLMIILAELKRIRKKSITFQEVAGKRLIWIPTLKYLKVKI